VFKGPDDRFRSSSGWSIDSLGKSRLGREERKDDDPAVGELDLPICGLLGEEVTNEV